MEKKEKNKPPRCFENDFWMETEEKELKKASRLL